MPSLQVTKDGIDAAGASIRHDGALCLASELKRRIPVSAVPAAAAV
jgi:hypothetical protein